MIGMQVAMQVALTPALPIEEQLSPTALMIAAQRLRPELSRVYQQNSLETLAFVFQHQNLDELRAYAAMLNSAAGQRYIVASNDGLNRALFSAAQGLGENIKTLLSSRSGQGV